MEKEQCPLCGSLECSVEPCSWYEHDEYICAKKIDCNLGYTFIVHDDVGYGSAVEVRRRYNLIRSALLHMETNTLSGYNYPLKFFYEENEIGKIIGERSKINLANDMRDYPFDIMDRLESILMNLSKTFPSIGQTIPDDLIDPTLFFCESDDTRSEISGIRAFLKELGYLTTKGLSCQMISANGWKKVFDIAEKEQEINQAFIAMSFAAEAEYIGDIFSKVIVDCGYTPQRIDQKEHNNQIVPEIFFEISRSKFVVVDVTYPNFGAYYEAGYGEALKKQVIVCCRKDVFDGDNRPHFDISQKSAIIWRDEKDLKEKLKRRIEATVGKRNVFAFSER